MILIQLHSIKVGAQEYHEKWNHTQIPTWSDLPGLNKGNTMRPQRKG